MCITEYDEERAIMEFREEGIEIGMLKTLFGLVKDGLLSLNVAAERANMTVEEFKAKLAEFKI